MGGKLRKTPDTYYVIYSVIFLLYLLLIYSLSGRANLNMPLLSSDNSIKYIICFNSEAKVLFQKSIDTLMESENSYFMVFKVINGEVKNLSGYEEWSETMEIDEGTYKKLHLNLCQKIGKTVRKKV